MNDLILQARENRMDQIKKLFFNDVYIISIKSNIPGQNKNLNEAYLLVRIFFNELKKNFSFTNYAFHESSDGPYFLCSIKTGVGFEIKRKLIQIEDTHALGRFIDLDLYTSIKKSISRQEIDEKQRKCYLCDEDASTCSRNKTHELSDLLLYLKSTVVSFIDEQISQMIEKSIMAELELDHKFGLVSKNSVGSHDDMDYQLMLKAKQVILPYLNKLFMIGYQAFQLDNLLEESRGIGIEAEQKMLIATNGINCYKGLIFVLGLSILASGYAIGHHESFDQIYTNISMMTKDIFEEFDQKPTSFGMEAYKNHQIKGVRGEVYLGLPSVQKSIHLLDRGVSEDSLRSTLKNLILESEDTVLLKRAKSVENYYFIKQMIKKIDLNNSDELSSFTDYAISNHLSFGGSADLLIVSVFLNFLHESFFMNQI